MNIMETHIFIKSLRLHCPIGVMEQEQVVGNDFIVDLRVGYDFSKAMESDSVEDTLNYAALYALLRRVLSQPVALVEKAAGNVAKALFQSWPDISSVDFRITKCNPPMGADCDGAGVEIHLINDKTHKC